MNVIKTQALQIIGTSHLRIYIVLMLGCLVHHAFASQPTVTAEEPKLRAVIVLGILRFTHWPEDAPITSTFYLCTVGHPPSENILSQVSGKRQLQNVPIKTLNLSDNSIDISKCNALIVGAGKKSQSVKSLLKGNAGYGLLTICDSCKVNTGKTHVRLERIENRISFVINRDKAQKSGMNFSSSLLELAVRVEEE